MRFNLDVAENTTLSCFFFFFLISDLYFLMSAATRQIFSSIVELIIPIRTGEKKQKYKLRDIQ